MEKHLENLKQRISDLTDEELWKMVEVNSDKYYQEAIKILMGSDYR